VLAISVRLAPESLAGDIRTRRVTSLRYYWSCSSLLPSVIITFSDSLRSSQVASYRRCYSTGLIGYCAYSSFGKLRALWFSRSHVALQSARFLTFDRRITECYSQLGAAVKTAQALGLHRDGASMVGFYLFLCSHC
jgi:hypothetical protein